MGSALILKQISRPKILYDRTHETVKLVKPTPRASNATLILDRIRQRKWLSESQDGLYTHITRMHWDVKLIEYLPRGKYTLLELKLDVERYGGAHANIWWLNQEGSEWIEETWKDAPKEKDYHIGNYWEQSAWYKEHGNCNVPGENTKQFILDRSKWAYKIIGKNIRICRRMVRILKNWNFTDEQQREYFMLENRLFRFGVIL